ncbi:MAG: TatD family hydrolase [Firmicutes bacterium]|nr:TatD family hydrolase [Bacillota bacterium]
MRLFDSHCHISDGRYADRIEELAEEIRAAGVERLVDIGTDLESSESCVRMAKRFDFCYAAVGFFPSETSGLTEEDLERLRQLSREPRVVAIGEIGLDYHYDDTDKPSQQHWFRRQIELAIEENKTIIVHSRDADDDTLRILRESGAFSKERTGRFPPKPDGRPDARVLLHCYSGSAELARTYEKLGASISLAGPVTFKNARRSVEVAQAADIRDLLVETDAPYLTPVPFRGQLNKPPYVRYTAEKIAEIRGNSLEYIAEQTYLNACRVFGLEPDGNVASGGAQEGSAIGASGAPELGSPITDER